MEKATDLSLKSKPKLYHQLVLLTGILGVSFIILFSLVIIVAEDQLEVISLHKWLSTEANTYALDYQLKSDEARVPNPYQFDFYTATNPQDITSIPHWLRQYKSTGFFEHQLGPEDKHFLIAAHPSGSGLMYIVFKDNADDYLDDYEDSLHWSAFLIGISMTFLTVAFGIYITRRIAKHLELVANRITLISPDQPEFSIESKYQELAIIEQSLLENKKRIDDFFRREQEFSRFAAHEIRTPLMVLQGSSELLQQLKLNPLATKASNRVQQASAEIRLLTDTFLLLGQEDIQQQHYQTVFLDHIIQSQLTFFKSLYPDDRLKIKYDRDHSYSLRAPVSFVTVVTNNLLKNAYSYACSELEIQIQEHKLIFQNDVIQDSKSDGFGYGLAIVRRVCERMGWVCEVNLTGKRFKVVLHFDSHLNENA